MTRSQKTFCLFLLAGCAASFFLSLAAGSAGFPVWQDETMRTILIHLRLPRALGALLAGSALALSGALVQSVLNNPLASANLIGINAGAGFFAILAGILFPASFLAGSILSFLGGLLSAGAVLWLVWKKRAGNLTVILAGMALSQLFSAGIDLLNVLVPDALSSYASFKIGSLASVSLGRAAAAGWLILPGIALCLVWAGQLEMFFLDPLQSRALGFPLHFWTVLFLALAAWLAAASVSLCGMLGFVGLLVPAWLRKKHLPSFWYLVECALCGAMLVSLADLLGRTLLMPWELPAGLILSLAGLPCFVALLLEGRQHHA